MRLLLFAAFVGACGGGHRGASDAGIDTASDAPVDAGPRCSRPYTPPAVHACANPWFPGRIAMPPSAVFGDGSSGKLALGDVDQDGRMDVVMPDGIESFGVYRGLQRDGFAAPALYTTHESLTSTAVLADFDQNGSLDVAVSTVPASFGVIATHNNAGDGTFGYAHDHIRHNLQPLAAFDTNNDGKNDLVLIEPSGNDVLVKVMLN